MPSISRIKKLSVLGVAIATLGVSATSASADDVWLWACHGPSGEGVGSAFGSNNLTDYAGGCAQQATDLDSGGLRGILGVNSDGEFGYGSTASANLTVPPGTSLSALRVERRLTGSVAARHVLGQGARHLARVHLRQRRRGRREVLQLPADGRPGRRDHLLARAAARRRVAPRPGPPSWTSAASA